MLREIRALVDPASSVPADVMGDLFMRLDKRKAVLRDVDRHRAREAEFKFGLRLRLTVASMAWGLGRRGRAGPAA